jgi:hypothetical protein
MLELTLKNQAFINIFAANFSLICYFTTEFIIKHHFFLQPVHSTARLADAFFKYIIVGSFGTRSHSGLFGPD